TRPPLHSVLQHEGERHGDGFAHQPLADRGSWGGAMGRAEFSPRSCVFVHAPVSRRESLMIQASVVFVVDDDPSVRSSLKFLIGSIGVPVESFDSADALLDLLQHEPPDAPSCLVLDVRLPGLSGLEFQRELAERNWRMPIIFITGYGDVSMSVRAMKAGAVEFLTKPFRDQDLLDAIQAALEKDHSRRQQERAVANLKDRFRSLTPREQQVVNRVVSGMLNKQIADELGIAENTVKVHRSRAMEKMHAQSLADLVRMIEKLESSAVRSSVRGIEDQRSLRKPE